MVDIILLQWLFKPTMITGWVPPCMVSTSNGGILPVFPHCSAQRKAKAAEADAADAMSNACPGSQRVHRDPRKKAMGYNVVSPPVMFVGV